MKKIIVIDDEPKIRRLFHRVLHEAGYYAIEADNALYESKRNGRNRVTIYNQ